MTASSSDRPRSAVIQVPSQQRDGAKRGIACTFNGMHGKRLQLTTSEALPVSVPVSVEYDDSLFLGEVITCAEAGNVWNIEIKIEQILSGLQSLMALRERLLSEGVPQPLTLLPVGASN